MELEGNLDVLPVFEEAVRVVLEVRHGARCCLYCRTVCLVPQSD